MKDRLYRYSDNTSTESDRWSGPHEHGDSAAHPLHIPVHETSYELPLGCSPLPMTIPAAPNEVFVQALGVDEITLVFELEDGSRYYLPVTCIDSWKEEAAGEIIIYKKECFFTLTLRPATDTTLNNFASLYRQALEAGS